MNDTSHPPSSADTLRKAIGENSSTDDLTLAHLEPVYQGMRSRLKAIDPDLVKDVVPLPVQDPFPDEVVGVIVETRAHKNLPILVEQAHDVLGIPVHIFCCQTNRDFIEHSRIKRLIEAGRVCITETGLTNLDRQTYSALMTSPTFWKTVRGRRKILVFQTDAVFCPKSPYSLLEFVKYDYIGSDWGRLRPEGITVDGGNGGLSLRDWPKTIDALERFPPSEWHGQEDTYFCFHLDLIGTVGKGEAPAQFGTQFNFLYKSFGAHKTDKLHWTKQILFLMYCTEARAITTQSPAFKAAIAKVLRLFGGIWLLEPCLRYIRKRRDR